jgi:DNA-directed RNA polymerase specialized sigma24 family protein
MIYQKQRVDIVSLEALSEVGYEPDDGGRQALSFGSDLSVEDLLKRLSPHQRKVALLLSEGYTRAEVMAKLGLSEKTGRINFHRLIVRIRRQLEVYQHLTGQKTQRKT